MPIRDSGKFILGHKGWLCVRAPEWDACLLHKTGKARWTDIEVVSQPVLLNSILAGSHNRRPQENCSIRRRRKKEKQKEEKNDISNTHALRDAEKHMKQKGKIEQPPQLTTPRQERLLQTKLNILREQRQAASIFSRVIQ